VPRIQQYLAIIWKVFPVNIWNIYSFQKIVDNLFYSTVLHKYNCDQNAKLRLQDKILILDFNAVFFGTNHTGLTSNCVPAVTVIKQNSWYEYTTSRYFLFQYKLSEYLENEFQQD